MIIFPLENIFSHPFQSLSTTVLLRNKEKGLGNKKTFFFPPPDYIFGPKAKEECRVFKGDLIFPSLLGNLVTIEELVLWKVLFFHFRVFGDVSLPFGL